MPKRRRERDRPKSGPESLYDQNKRVLLSYESDDEEEEHASRSPSPPRKVIKAKEGTIPQPEYARSAVRFNQESKEALEEDGEHGDDVQSAHEDGLSEEEEKHSTRKRPRQRRDYPLRNGTTGQFAALGLWSYQWEDEEYEPGSDEEEISDHEYAEAMAYLEAVR